MKPIEMTGPNVKWAMLCRVKSSLEVHQRGNLSAQVMDVSLELRHGLVSGNFISDGMHEVRWAPLGSFQVPCMARSVPRQSRPAASTFLSPFLCYPG